MKKNTDFIIPRLLPERLLLCRK